MKTSGTRYFLHSLVTFLVTILLPAFAYAQPTVGTTTFDGLINSTATYTSGTGSASASDVEGTGWNFHVKNLISGNTAAVQGINDQGDDAATIDDDIISMTASGGANTDYISFSSSDGSEFQLGTFKLYYTSSGNATVTVTAYRDGSEVGSSSQGTLTRSSWNTIDVSANTSFDNVDEIRISYGSPNAAITRIDDINIAAAVASNTAPSFNSSASAYPDENTSTSTVILNVNADDGDGGANDANVTYSLSGTDAADFTIDSDDGELRFAVAPDFENPADDGANNVYNITVTADDGEASDNTTTQDITIEVNDLNDNTPVITASQSFSISQDATNGTVLGTVSASDADAGSSLSGWTIISGNGDGVFAINSSSGELTVADNSNLDLGTTSSYTLGLIVNDGTNTSSSETISISVTGPAGALSFDGANDYVQVANNEDLEFSEGTIEMWLKPTDYGNVQGSIIAIRGGSTRYSFHLNPQAGTVGLWNGSAFTTTSASFTTGEWNHFALVISDSNVEVFANGTSQGSISSTINTGATGLPLIFGAPTSGATSEMYNGEMDEVRIWDTKLSSETINLIKNKQLSGSEDGLVAYYNFNNSSATVNSDNSGQTTLADSTSNGLNGTLNNFALSGSTSNWSPQSDSVSTDILSLSLDLTTSDVSVFIDSSATMGGEITSQLASVTERGVVYSSTDTSPQIGETGVTKDANGPGTGTFSETITGLSASTTYYVQAYAMNSSDTSYGGVETFTTTADVYAPVVTEVNSTTDNFYYSAADSDTVVITVSFSENVTVVGTPQLELETGDTDQIINYSSGSGTKVLSFIYAVQAGDSTPDLDYKGTTALSLNGGTIQDAAGNDATLTLATPGTPNSLSANKGIVIDNVLPVLSQVTSFSADGTYTTGGTINIAVAFNEVMSYTGTPQLELETGETDRILNLVSGSGSTIRFLYTVQSGDESADLDYVSTTALTLNGGTITDVAGNPAILTLPTPGSANSLGGKKNFVIDGVVPTVAITSEESSPVSLAAFDATITFSEEVNGFTESDITVSNGSVTGFSSSDSTVFTVEITPSADGALTIDVASDVATDNAGNSNTAASQFSVTVNSNQNTPVITASQSFSVDEGASNSTVVGTVAATDGDAGTTFSNWTITAGNDDGVFAINSSTGQLTVADNSSLDFESTESYTLTLAVSDGTNTSSGEDVTIEVNDLNDNNPVVTASQSFSVEEDAANGTVVGTVAATDADANTSFSFWVITGGNDDGVFAINSSTGQITVSDNSTLDYETTGMYTLSVTVTDGTNTSSAQTVDIEVNDLNDNDPVVTASQSFSVDEEASNSTVVGTVAATDGDASTTFSGWTITAGNSDGVFAINSSTGQITITDNTNLDFETTESYTLTVTVTDGTNTSSSETVDIEVNDLNDNDPVVTASQSFSVDEQESNGAVVGTVAATDADAGTSFSGWSITAGNGEGVFAINSSTGQITITDNTNLDFETTESYTLTVTVTDGTNTSSSETVDIEVNDLNDNDPVVTVSQSFSVDEDASNSTVVGTVAATDADANTSFSGWFITSGNSDGVFAINSSTGQITITDNSTLNFENKSTYTLSVTVTDGTNTSAAEDVIINVNNPGGFTVTETDGSTLTSETGTTDSFTVVLNAQPASDVVIDVTSGDTGEGTVDKSSLTFTNANWDTPQTVTVTGVDDDIIDGSQSFKITLSIDAASSDDDFDALGDQTVSVDNSDDDAAGFSIAETDGTTVTTEAGGEDSFTVLLDAEPSSNVVIDVTSGDTGEATVSMASLTFTSANWDTPQTVTVTGVDDDVIDGSQTFNITMSIDAASSDDDFDSVGDQTVSVDNSDDDSAAFTVTESAGTTEVSESGTTDDFTVVLDAEPASNVVITITSGDTGEGTVDKSSLTFTTANWDTPQTVTITGVDDADIDGDIDFNVTLSIDDASSDDDFDALGDQIVSVTNTDDDQPDTTAPVVTSIVRQSPASEIVNASSVTFRITFDEPVISFGIGDFELSGGGSAFIGSAAQVTPGTVFDLTVSGIDANGTLELGFSDDQDITDNSGNEFEGEITTKETYTIKIPGFTVTESDGSTSTTEAGGEDSFTVVLDAEPSGNVVIDVTSGDTGEATVSSSSLTFTTANWDTPQAVTVTGVDDDVIDGSQTFNITLSINDASSDDDFDVLGDKTVSVDNTDDDVAGFTISESNGSTEVSESGNSDTFTVVLAAQPASNVVLDVTSGDTGEGTVSTSSLTFTPVNWDTPQTITITGVDDTDLDGDIEFDITLSVDDASSDDDFDALGDQTVTVTNEDDDTPGITVSESNGTTITSETGTTDSFKVVLDIAPASDVVIDVTSENTSEGTVSPASLVFTVANWNVSQTVTVTGVDDSIDDDTVSYAVTLSVNDAGSNDVYDDVEDLSVTVFNADDDSAGFTIADQDSDRFTSEGGETSSFTVVLNTQPVSDVVFNVASDNTAEGTTDVSSLTFTSANWDTPQTVTITGADDDVDDGGVSYNISVSVNTASSDDAFDGLSSQSVEVLNYDDDSAGFTVVESNDSTSVGEPGTTDNFTVVLESEPTSDVVINVSSGDTGEGTLDVSTLTFTSANWDTPQTVTVTGVDDDIIDGTVFFSIFLTVDAVSSDDNYDFLDTQSVTASNTDNDTAKLVFTDVQGNEDGGGITVTATLDQAVEGGFTVEVSTRDSSATTADSDYTPLTGETLTFAGNANESQQFSITPNSDNKVETNEIVKLIFGNLSTSVNIDITDIGYVTIVNDDAAPVFTSVDSVEVEENQALILTVQASDVDEGTTIEYSITGGVDQSLFNIDKDSGELSFNAAPNFEDPKDSDSDNEYLVQVQATDGANEVLQDVVIIVTDKNEFAPVITSESNAIVYEGSAQNTEILTVTSTDADGTSSVVYSISQNVNGNSNGTNTFSIDSLSGVITLSDPDDLDRDSNPELEIEVTVSDGQFEAAQTILITVLTPPVAESLSPLDGAEGIALNGSISMTFDQSVESVDLSGITLTDANSSSISGVSPTLSDSTISFTYSGLNNLTEYTVTIPAGAVENSDGVGNISIEWSFTTIVEAPEQVVLLTPESGNGSISVKPGFTWESIARAETAVFQISTEDDFATNVIEISDISTTELTLTDSIQFYQKYFWRVRGINEGGEGPWSEVSSFITEASVPDLVFPSDGQNGISTAPKMRWASPHEGTSYQFQFSTTETLDNILRDVMLTEKTIQLQGLTADAEYFWRVRIVTDSTTSEWSDIQNFFTRPNPSVVETAPLPVTITFGQGTPGDTTGGSQNSGKVEQTDYRMVGLPGTDGIRLDEFFEGPYKKSWRAFIETGDDLNFYDEYSADDNRFIFTPGLGFWVLSTEIVADQYSFTAVETDENDSYGIKVHEGWNIIANPYQSEVEWDLVLEYNNISGEIFGYDEQFLTSDTMKVLQGYYFYNAPEFSMDTLFIPYTGFDQRGQEKQRSPIDLSGVNKLVLEAKIGKEISHNIEIIYSDTMDAYKERIATNYPDLSFAKTGMVLSEEKDSREKKSRLLGTYKPESEMYHVEVKGKVGSSLKWNAQFEGLAEDAAVLLVNSVTNESKIITRTEAFKIQISEPLSRYNMYVGQLNYLIELEERLIPDQIILHPNYPNPFNPSTTINYALKERVDVRLEVYDVLGRLVQTLVNEQQDAGWHKVRFDGSSLSSGMYFYRLHAGGELKLGKMTLIK